MYCTHKIYVCLAVCVFTYICVCTRVREITICLKYKFKNNKGCRKQMELTTLPYMQTSYFNFIFF